MKQFLKNKCIFLTLTSVIICFSAFSQTNKFEFNLFNYYSQLNIINQNTQIQILQTSLPTNPFSTDSISYHLSVNSFQYHTKNGTITFASYIREMFCPVAQSSPCYQSNLGITSSVPQPNDVCIVNRNMQTIKFNLNGQLTDRICFLPKRHTAANSIPYNRTSTGLLNANQVPIFILSKPKSVDSLAYVIAVDSNNHLVLACFNTLANGGMGVMRILPYNPDQRKILPSISYTPHRNGRDIWIYAQALTQDSCYAYLLDSNGLHPPVVSTPKGYASPPFSAAGTPKRQYINNIFTADGKYLINYFDSTFVQPQWTAQLTPYMRHILCIYPFNNLTGQCSNAYIDTFPHIYFEHLADVESSSDGSKIYISTSGHSQTKTQSHFIQYDLSGLSSNPVLNPIVLKIDSQQSNAFKRMILFPDNKIYFANADLAGVVGTSNYNTTRLKSAWIGRINAPNLNGAACQIQYNVLCDTTPRNFVLAPPLGWWTDFANYNSRFLARAKDTQIVHICYGTSYPVGSHVYQSTGQYTDTLLTVPFAYDSILITKLYVHHPSFAQQNVQTCNTSYQLPSGKWVSSPGNYVDTLFTLSGCDSIISTKLQFGHSTSSILQKRICTNEGLVFNNHVITQAGTYRDTLVNHWGCDSFITLNVNKPNPNTTITLNTATLSTNTSGCTYQWVECTSNSPNVFTIIPGATNPTFNPTHNGYYACLITQDSCQFTSNVIQITNLNTGIQQLDNTVIQIKPNPSNNEWNIVFNSPVLIHKYTLYNELGQVVFEKAQTSIENNLHINASNLSAGHYLLEINSESGIVHCKLVCSR